MTEWFAMGNYGAYVWSCYAITFTVVIICMLQGRSRHRRIVASVRARILAMESKT